MEIKLGPVSRRTPVYEVQAHYLAKAIHQLADARARQFREGIELSLEDFYRFSGMPEYEHFVQATIVCCFVCTDYSRFFPLDKVHDRPNEVVPTLPFSKVRHYIHTLQRTEKWNSEYSTALWTAVTSGALFWWLVAWNQISPCMSPTKSALRKRFDRDAPPASRLRAPQASHPRNNDDSDDSMAEAVFRSGGV